MKSPIQDRAFGGYTCLAAPTVSSADNADRQSFVAGGVTHGSADIRTSGIEQKEATEPNSRRIDFHHHVSPPPHVNIVRKVEFGNPTPYSAAAQKSLEEMDKAGITTALITVTPSTTASLNNDDARQVARECNEHLARLKADFPAQFGMLATIPMPYAEDSVKEIEYAYETLAADGICLMTSYGDKWLGYPGFAPVLELLHRRKAVVHVHPRVPNCCVYTLPNIAPNMIEFSTDTTRTIASLIFTGTSARYKDINFIFSHGGGTMPYLIERFNNLPNGDPRYASFTPEGVISELQRFYYDTAIVTHPAPLSALTNLIPLSQLVFGSDIPFRSGAKSVEGLRDFFNAESMKAVDSENAQRLIPKLKAI